MKMKPFKVFNRQSETCNTIFKKFNKKHPKLQRFYNNKE